MQDENTKRLLELQMEELKSVYSIEGDDSATEVPKEDQKAILAKKRKEEKDAQLAKLYEDAAEYEEELDSFEKELVIVNSYKVNDIAEALTTNLPNEERNYEQELKNILIASWTHYVETEKSHPLEELELIKETEFCDLIEKFNATYPQSGDFETVIKNILVKRLEALIEIKKEHIEEEMEEIYIAGLKPSFVKRIYKQVHGIK